MVTGREMCGTAATGCPVERSSAAVPDHLPAIPLQNSNGDQARHPNDQLLWLRGEESKRHGHGRPRPVRIDRHVSIYKHGFTNMDPVNKALWFIESHFRQELTLDEVADAGGVSRFHMSRVFAVTMGCS